MISPVIDSEQMNECLRRVQELRKPVQKQEKPMSGKVVRSWVK